MKFQAIFFFSALLTSALPEAAELAASNQSVRTETEGGGLSNTVQAAFDAARRNATFGVPRFKRLSYSFKNEIMIPGYPKQKNPKLATTEIFTQGDQLVTTFTPMANFSVKTTTIFGGLVIVSEPANDKKCSGSAISQLQAELPPVLEVGSKLRVQYVLSPISTEQCEPTSPIDEQCEATSQMKAKTMHAALTGRAIKLQCWTSNRMTEGRLTYKVYLEDLGIVMSSTELEHQGKIMRTFTSFVIER